MSCVQPCCTFRGCGASLCGGPWDDGIDSFLSHELPRPSKAWSRVSAAVPVAMAPVILLLLCGLAHAGPAALEIVEVLPNTSNTNSLLSHRYVHSACLYQFDSYKIPCRLNTSKSEPLRVGQPYTLSCHVADSHAEVESCSWQFGAGPQIPAPQPGSTGGVQPREGTISQSSKSCNLTLHSLSLEHMGTWTCR